MVGRLSRYPPIIATSQRKSVNQKEYLQRQRIILWRHRRNVLGDTVLSYYPIRSMLMMLGSNKIGKHKIKVRHGGGTVAVAQRH
jgi:hypothetical protein